MQGAVPAARTSSACPHGMFYFVNVVVADVPMLAMFGRRSDGPRISVCSLCPSRRRRRRRRASVPKGPYPLLLACYWNPHRIVTAPDSDSKIQRGASSTWFRLMLPSFAHRLPAHSNRRFLSGARTCFRYRSTPRSPSPSRRDCSVAWIPDLAFHDVGELLRFRASFDPSKPHKYSSNVSWLLNGGTSQRRRATERNLMFG